MKHIALIVVVLTLAATLSLNAQNIHKEWEFQTPTTHFPVFFSSDPKYDVLLNDYFARHWFADPGPASYTGPQATIWREWDALCTVWLDTSRNKAYGRDYNADLKDCLLRVQLDSDGYVYSFPPSADVRNKLGWLVPTYGESRKRSTGWDWQKSDPDGWGVTGGGTTTIGNSFWNLSMIEKGACIQYDHAAIDAYQSPYIIVTMAVSRPGAASFEWTTESTPDWSEANRVQFTVTNADPATYYLPVYKAAGWTGKIKALRLRPLTDVPSDGIDVIMDRIDCAYDTRQVVNNPSFILANWRYYLWTGDKDFLQRNMPRLRAAAHYLRSTLKSNANGLLVIPYWGQDGTSGISPSLREGYGIGSDYWGHWGLPTGYKSAYANAYYAASLRAMADLEDRAIDAGIKPDPNTESPDSHRKQATAVAKKAADLFWDEKTGRFIGCEDADGKRHDYGFAYLNLEALYYGLGDSTKAASIYTWLDGTRKVDGDTSTGADIYNWKFAPRATTKRNTDWYVWTCYDPKAYPWGSLIKDGGATAYVSFYDIMDRIRYKSPDDAYARLTGILDWYDEVWEAGGYRKYYSQAGRGTLGESGGLGIDAGFVETTLVPTSFLYGFMGVSASTEGLKIEPKLPSGLSYAGVKNVTYYGCELTIICQRGKITVKCTRNPKNQSFMLSGRRVVGTFDKAVDVDFAVLKPVD